MCLIVFAIAGAHPLELTALKATEGSVNKSSLLEAVILLSIPHRALRAGWPGSLKTKQMQAQTTHTMVREREGKGGQEKSKKAPDESEATLKNIRHKLRHFEGSGQKAT